MVKFELRKITVTKPVHMPDLVHINRVSTPRGIWLRLLTILLSSDKARKADITILMKAQLGIAIK